MTGARCTLPSTSRPDSCPALHIPPPFPQWHGDLHPWQDPLWRSGLGLPQHQGRSGFSDLRWGPPILSLPGPSQLDWSLKRIWRTVTSPCGVPSPEESSPLVVPSIGSPRLRQSQLSLDAPPPGVLSLFASFASHGRRRSLMPSSSYTLAPDGRLGHGMLVPPGSDPGADRS